MTDLALERFAFTDFATFGRMKVGGETIYTVELPWRHNEPRISCIPEGTYRCKPRRYNKGGYQAIEITGVPNRHLILFHKGNTASDVLGCIAVGLTLGSLNGQWAVLGSKQAFERLMASYGGREFDLTIRAYEPGKAKD